MFALSMTAVGIAVCTPLAIDLASRRRWIHVRDSLLPA